MENQKESQEEDKFGNVTFGEASRLLIDIIGQNVILDSIPQKEHKAFMRNLERIYNNPRLATVEAESPIWYFKEFFINISKYKLPHYTMKIIEDFYLKLLYALTWSTPFEKPKKETALLLIKKELFYLIYHILKKEEHLYDYIIKFLTDNYDNIFAEAESNYKNEKIFYEEINNYCVENYKKYPK